MHLLIDMMNSEVGTRVGDAGKPAYDFLSHKSMNSLTVVRPFCVSLTPPVSTCSKHVADNDSSETFSPSVRDATVSSRAYGKSVRYSDALQALHRTCKRGYAVARCRYTLPPTGI